MATSLTNQPALRLSFDALSSIDELLRNPDFTDYFIAGIQREADKLADSVLHDESLTDKEREDKRQQRKGLLFTLSFLAMEKQAHENILSMNGLTRGDDLPGE